MVNINTTFEKTYKLSSDQSFSLIFEWLVSKNAKILSDNPPHFIRATHGSIDEENIYDPDYKKDIIVRIEEIDIDSVNIIIDVIHSAEFIQKEKLINALKNKFFHELFEILEKGGGQEEAPMSELTIRFSDEQDLMEKLDNLYKEWESSKEIKNKKT